MHWHLLGVSRADSSRANHQVAPEAIVKCRFENFYPPTACRGGIKSEAHEIIVPADDVVRDVEVVLANGGACATPANIVLSSDGVWPVPPDG
ncbi:MAG: hypothetical protein DYH07_08755 [Armatimonadetes bacterium ATM1]|nr:hypothetical protein [Armatimonadetes bacterium ATM1]